MRVDRTTAFVDLSLFTAFSIEHGDAAAADVLGAFRTLVRAVASRRSIRVAKWLGDGAMLVSQDPAAAVAGALELRYRAADVCGPLALRAGVASGPVLLFEGDDYLGTSVNLAARLCDHAKPHEALASLELMGHLPAWATAEPAGTRELKGFAAPVPVLSLGLVPVDEDHVVDPVCGLPLRRIAATGLQVAADGRWIGFCDASCAAAWDGSEPLMHGAI